MRRIEIIFLMVLLSACTNSFSQKSAYKEGNSFGFTVNVGAGSYANALSWSHYHSIGKNRRLKVGYGLRFTGFIGTDLEYTTAPAKYTSGTHSIAALFSENILANIDTLNFPKSQTNFLNAGIYFSYLLPIWKNRIELGVNIDAVGVTFGARKNALYKNSTVPAKPTPVNLLLISDSDKGSLNSEWYVGFWATNRFMLKAGYEFLFSEYTTDNKVQQLPNSKETNDRFRFKGRMVLVGIEFAPFRK